METNSEWKLLPERYQKITKTLFQPKVDLFASRLCYQLPLYLPWKAEPTAVRQVQCIRIGTKISICFLSIRSSKSTFDQSVEWSSQPSYICNTSLANTATVLLNTLHVNFQPNLASIKNGLGGLIEPIEEKKKSLIEERILRLLT